MSIQKIIQESLNGNPLEMKEALAEELRSRVAEAITAKMEEVELDEVSGAKLGSYYVKAKKNRDTERDKAQDVFKKAMADPDPDVHNAQKEYTKHNTKANKRDRGMSRAMDKLTGSGFAKVHATEEFDLSDYTVEELEDFIMSEDFEQLDEISKKTLASYVKKASADQYSKGQSAQYHANKANKASGTFEKETKAKHRAIADKTNMKAANRDTGIKRAVDRLAK